METKNHVKNPDGSIDCEVKHPTYGWVPFTASPEDVEGFGRDLFTQINNSDLPEKQVLHQASIHDVRNEAERRIAVGTRINGRPFVCDVRTVTRLRGLIDLFESDAVPVDGVTYKTSHGDTLSINSLAEAQRIYGAVVMYVSGVIEASAKLQTMEPIPQDYTDDKWWVDNIQAPQA